MNAAYDPKFFSRTGYDLYTVKIREANMGREESWDRNFDAPLGALFTKSTDLMFDAFRKAFIS
jgi:hypothetical protein